MSEALPQLIMRNSTMEQLPPLYLPHGVSLHNHVEGSEKNWEELIERAFEQHFSFDDFIRNKDIYKPENVLYLSKDGRDIATTTVTENANFPREGWLRMVATDPKARGIGAGRLIVLAALHALAASGYKTTVLSTDDWRIPAITLYYSLGFRPVYTHESHEARWSEILPKLKVK